MTVNMRKKENLQGRIQEILRKLGVTRARIGDMYLEEAVKIVYENPEAIYNCREDVYNVISKRHNVSRASLEVALGYTVKQIRDGNELESLKKYFGRSIESRREALKPTEVIGTLAEYLRIQERPQSLESRISKMLIDLRLFPSTYAVKYLSEAIQIVYSEPEFMSEMLEKIAQKYNIAKPVVNSALNKAAKCFREQSNIEFLKEYFGETIIIRKEQMTPSEIIGTLVGYLHVQENPESLESRTLKILMELGVFPNTCGARYLKDAICTFYSIKVPVRNQVVKMYALIATRYGINRTSVERAIRNTIEHAVSEENRVIISKYFGNVSSKEKGRPTNAQFIANIVNYLHIQEDEQNQITHRIISILNEIGIDPKTAGYEYLIKAIQKGYEDPTTIINYAVAIQDKHDATTISLCIYNVILKAWKHILLEVFEKYFKLPSEDYFNLKTKPTNTDFILAIVYYLKAEDTKNS